jgi:DNA-binding NtrC family response regulator
MTVAIIGTAQIPLQEVAAALHYEGVSVKTAVLTQELEQQNHLDGVRSSVVIIAEQGVITIGEETTRVRALLSSESRLILCIPQLSTDDRNALLEEGVSSTITPQTWAIEHIAERVLSQLILDGEIQPSSYGEMQGATAVMRSLYSDIERIAPLSEPILILGQTGTGKELVAKAIHDRSGRDGIYLPINCPEISPELLSSELFGHEKGAFSGADKSRVGLIASAGRGTVFLDEIGELDLPAQAKMLRVLEYRKVRRVGANNWDDVEARIVLATNRNLEELCGEGKFRRDLYERIRGFTLKLPSLNKRKADIVLLANYFVEKYNEEYNTNLIIPDGAVDCLFRYDWPGNIRELRGAVRKAAAYADNSKYLSRLILQEATRGRVLEDVPDSVPFDPARDTWRDLVGRAQKVYFRALLEKTQGNKEKAAKLSGLSRSQFFEKLKEIQKGKMTEE